MPYWFEATKLITVEREPAFYVNKCCVGTDVVAAPLIQALTARFGNVDDVQEDWGWQIWFFHNSVEATVCVHGVDPTEGHYLVSLQTKAKTFGFIRREKDTPLLDEIRVILEPQLRRFSDRVEFLGTEAP